jgi:ATP-dependent RNA helicase DDX51/DBP6
MFNVGRYDPTKRADDGTRPKKKHKNNRPEKKQSTRRATVVPPPVNHDEEQKNGGDRQPKRTNQEDDRKKPKRKIAETVKAARGAVKPKKLQVIAKEQKEDNQILDSLDGRFDRLIQIEFEVQEQEQEHVDEAGDQQDEFPAISAGVSIAMELSQRPIQELAVAWKLKPFLVENLLQRQKLSHFFPIQCLTIPHIIATSPYIQAPDLMITAPTGSGKTLSYAVPVLQAIPIAGPRLLRTIIILPGRELAMQVESVLQSYCHGSHIRIGLAIAAASTDFAAEHALLTDDPDRIHDPSQLRRRLDRDPANVRLAIDLLDDRLPYPAPLIESSSIDILVCTPGRLMDHLHHTAGGGGGGGGLSLQHLRHLVIDEADRLLAMGSYQNWLDRVLQLAPVTVRTLLVSATATTDPRRIARFHNIQHLSIASHQRLANVLTLPASLQEFTVECAAAQKPLVLVSILMEQQRQQQTQKETTAPETASSSSITMVFCSSLESTHRLARLLQLLWVALGYDEDHIGEMSSSVRGNDRRILIDRCRDPSDRLSVLVCSDGMARGMDLEQIATIVHYDIPTTSPKTYVHRCGRTARAGRSGRAISLIKTGQMDAFGKMRLLIQPPPPPPPASSDHNKNTSRVSTWPIQKNLVNDAMQVYSHCMDALQKVLNAEDEGTVRRGDAIQSFLA